MVPEKFALLALDKSVCAFRLTFRMPEKLMEHNEWWKGCVMVRLIGSLFADAEMGLC